MAVEARHISASVRLIDNSESTVVSYHRIRPDINAEAVDNVLNGALALRGQTGGNAYLTITTQLVEAD